MSKPKPKAETIRGALTVTLTPARGGWLVSWRKPIAQALYIPQEATARTLAEQLARGGSQVNTIGHVLDQRRRVRSTSKAGAASWAGLTPEQRADRARRIAAGRWKPKPDAAAPAETGAES